MSSGDGCCYVCNECPNSYSTLEDLEIHLRVHLLSKIQNSIKAESPLISEEAIQMPDDDVESRNSPTSSEHSDSHLDINDITMDESSEIMNDIDLKPGYNCRFCPSNFENQSQLNIHYTHTHRDKPQYTCEVCHTVFGIKRELATHMRIHSGEQPHKCTQCNKEFGTRQLLKKHWMWHTGERSHVCPHCNKAFFQKGHLTQHLMIHAGGRPHQCNLCQKTFIFKFDLNRHMKIHAERGFSCTQCGRSFCKQNQLDEHSLKCKGGRSSVSISRTSTPTISQSMRRQSTPAAMFPIHPQPILPFSPDDINKMAQTLLAQQHQRTLASMFGQQNPLAQFEKPIAQLSCFFCPQKFPNQPSLALHMGVFHMNNNILNAHLPKQNEEIAPTLSVPSSLSVFSPVNPIKTESDEVITSNSGHDSATNSSCASSPQKVSPTTSADHIQPSPAISEMSHSPGPHSENKCCLDCDRNRSRSLQLESELERQRDELDKARQALRQVSSIAQQLGACLPFDPQFFNNTKNVFSQIQSIVRNIECQ